MAHAEGTVLRKEIKNKPILTVVAMSKLMEPYSLFPQKEIEKLLRIYGFLTLINAKRGFSIEFPCWGLMGGVVRKNNRYWDPSADTYREVEPRMVPRFLASPFARWFFAPDIRIKFMSEKILGLYSRMRKLMKELWYIPVSEYEDQIPGPEFEEEALKRKAISEKYGIKLPRRN